MSGGPGRQWFRSVGRTSEQGESIEVESSWEGECLSLMWSLEWHFQPVCFLCKWGWASLLHRNIISLKKATSPCYLEVGSGGGNFYWIKVGLSEMITGSTATLNRKYSSWLPIYGVGEGDSCIRGVIWSDSSPLWKDLETKTNLVPGQVTNWYFGGPLFYLSNKWDSSSSLCFPLLLNC